MYASFIQCEQKNDYGYIGSNGTPTWTPSDQRKGKINHLNEYKEARNFREQYLEVAKSLSERPDRKTASCDKIAANLRDTPDDLHRNEFIDSITNQTYEFYKKKKYQ